MDEQRKETVKWKGKGVSDMSEWNYGRWALNLRSLRADLLQVLLWSERSETATATSSNSWLNSWLLNRPSAMLSGRLPGQSATLPINVRQLHPATVLSIATNHIRPHCHLTNVPQESVSYHSVVYDEGFLSSSTKHSSSWPLRCSPLTSSHTTLVPI